MQLLLDRLASPIGEILLVCDGGVLRALDFAEYEGRMRRLLRLQYGPATLAAGAAPAAISQLLARYFAGEVGALAAIETATGGTLFQRAVWSALRQIPPGETWPYGAVARMIGKHRASRAVGAANGANPLAIVVPCHRVVGSDARLTGYAGGLPRKAWLLAHEKAAMSRQFQLPGLDAGARAA